MATIELGAVREEVPDGLDRPRRFSMPGRSFLLAGLMVGLLATVAGGSPWPAPLPQAEVPARLGALIIPARDRMFVADPVHLGQAGQQLAAFRLPGGEPLWRVPLPTRETISSFTLVGDTLVLTANWWRLPNREQGQVVALNASTGATLWDRRAALETTNAAGELILWFAQTDSPDLVGTSSGLDLRPGTLQAVDPLSGAVRWSMPLPSGANRSYDQKDGQTSNVLVTLPSGRVELRDLSTGATVRAIELPPPGVGIETRWAGQVLSGLFLVHERRTITAYSLDRLDRRWSIASDLDPEYAPVACGDHLCAYQPEGGVRFIDRDAGLTRWSDPRWSSVWRAGDHLIGSVWGQEGERDGPLTVLDPASGRPLGELGVWETHIVSSDDPRFLGVRVDRQGRALVAEIDVPSRTVRVLAVLRQVSNECGITGKTFYCRTIYGPITLLRLRP